MLLENVDSKHCTKVLLSFILLFSDRFKVSYQKMQFCKNVQAIFHVAIHVAEITLVNFEDLYMVLM